MSLSDKASQIAAAATGLRPDQIKRAVEEYRAATAELHSEPEWTALSHMSFTRGGGIHLYRDPSEITKVALQIDVARNGEQSRTYTFEEVAYETYSEAREVELHKNARPKPYALPPNVG